MRRFLAVLGSAAALLAGALVPASPAQAATHDPVIFVHGFFGNTGQFDPMIKDLTARGWDKSRLFAWSYLSTNSNVQTANEFKAYVATVKKQTGATRIDIVNHSMGAIATRYYLKQLGGAATTDAWISLGGPNKGTTTASLCTFLFAACVDQVPGSPILNLLNSGDPTPGDTRYYTVYSSCDGTINPYQNILIDTATNFDAGCVSHNNYMSTANVQAAVAFALG